MGSSQHTDRLHLPWVSSMQEQLADPKVGGLSGASPGRPISANALRISVVLPTMNEEKNAAQVCQKLYDLRLRYSALTEAMFVLNNTTDDTEKVLTTISKRPGCGFIKVTHSEGARGTAIRRGVEMAQGNIVVVMDSDGQYDPAEIPKLVETMTRGEYCVAIGRNHGSASFLRRLISETYKKLTKILLGLEYVQTGIKAGIREVLLETIPRGVPGLDIDVRWMNNIVRMGYGDRLSDNVEVRFHPRLHGKSTFNPFKLSLGLLYTTLSLSIERRTGRELPFPQILKRLTLRPKT